MRGVLRSVLGALLLVVVVWLGVWWWAEGQMAAGITAWASQTGNSAGEAISYDRISRGTSPLAATVTLTNLRVALQPDASAQPVQIVLPTVLLRIDAFHPFLLRVEWPSRINVNTARADIAITSGQLETTEAIDPHELFTRQPYPFKNTVISGHDIDALASGGSLLILHIDSLAAQASFNRDAKATDVAYQFTSAINGIALSPLLTRLASIPFDGKISELGLSANISGPVPANFTALTDQIKALAPNDDAGRNKLMVQAVHDWAAAGGNATSSFSLVLGPSTLNAKAAVAFNAQAQPSGTADITADHLDEVSAAITNAYPQTQNAANEIEAHLSPYLTSSDAGGQTLTMHVIYSKNTVSINGQTVVPLPPLDWNTLENPPPPVAAPASAPGDGSGAAL
ncbi:MAG: DUF2125 domain-containing protein [Acidocella sp.]|nr:DUF2125 domain-containing protein [Acidocella sp.]